MTRIIATILDEAIRTFGFEDEEVILLFRVAEDELLDDTVKETLIRKWWAEMNDPMLKLEKMLEEAYTDMITAVTREEEREAVERILTLQQKIKEMRA